MMGNSERFFVICGFFLELIFKKKKAFRNTIRVSNSLDPDQARQFVFFFFQNLLFKFYGKLYKYLG